MENLIGSPSFHPLSGRQILTCNYSNIAHGGKGDVSASTSQVAGLMRAAWPHSWGVSDIVRDMTFLELFPVYVAILLWSHRLANERILFHVDNAALVQVFNSATSKYCPQIGSPYPAT